MLHVEIAFVLLTTLVLQTICKPLVSVIIIRVNYACMQYVTVLCVYGLVRTLVNKSVHCTCTATFMI